MSLLNSYTEVIGKGGDFKDFALACARAFGPLVSMGNLPIGTPIPDNIDVIKSHYHEDELKKALIDLDRWETQPPKERTKQFKAEHKKWLKYYKEHSALEIKIKKQLNKIKIKVDAWIPPSKDHEALKNFMIEQLQYGSNEWYVKYYNEEFNRWKNMDEGKWAVETGIKLVNGINYHQKEIREEEEKRKNIPDPNIWVRQLKQSLNIK